MARLVALVLVVSGLTLLAPPPAVAAVTVSLSADPTTYIEGGSTTLRGTARRARLGSVVKLQKKRGSSWVTIGRQTLGDSRRFSFRVSPDRGRYIYRVLKPRQFGQPRAVSPKTVVTVTWRPVISVSATGHLDPDADVWVTTVSGTAPELRSATLVVHRYADGDWAATDETVVVQPDGTFSHVLAGGAKGTRYRFVSEALGLRLPAWSPDLTVAAEVYTPTVAVSVEPTQHTLETGYPRDVQQEQRVAITTNAPDAPITVEVYAYDDHIDGWLWRTYRRGTTLADGSFTALLRNLPEGTRVRAVVAASEDGVRKPSTSPEATTTLIPIPVTVDGPQIDIFDITRDRGTLVQFDTVAGELLTFEFHDAYSLAGTTVSWRLLGPDGAEVPEQQYIRGPSGEHLTRFYVPTQTGTHTFVLSSDSSAWPAGEDARVTLSSPKEVPFAFDVTKQVTSNRPWELVDLTMTAAAGQVFSLSPRDIGHSCPTAQVIQNGQVVIPLFADMDTPMRGTWRIPADGPFAIRLWPCDRDHWFGDTWQTGFRHIITAIRAATATLPFRNESTRIDLNRGQYGVIDIDTTAGKVITVTKEDWYYVGGQLVEAPDGSVVVTKSTGVDYQFEFTATQSGTYRLWSGPAEYDSSYVVWSATERNN